MTDRSSIQASAGRIAPGDRCWAKTGGGVRSIAWVKEDIGKGYMLSVGSPSSPAQYFGNAKVNPLNAPIRKPLARSKPMPRHPRRRAQRTLAKAIPTGGTEGGLSGGPTFLAVSEPSVMRPVLKPEKPARSPSYRAWVRRQACCNCFARGPSDPHHEGPHGLGQKTSDFNCVPLCRDCHRHLTDSAQHLLPDPSQGAPPGKVAMRSLDVSQSIMRATKQQLLLRALGKLPLDRQVELLAAALAAAEELAHLLT